MTCDCVRSWLQAGLDAESVPPDLAEHVVGCVRCRGALVVLVEELAQREAGGCAACEDDLAAFIDIEADDGPEAAARLLPHVWWHLWRCPSCAETYELTRYLRAAEDAGVLAPPPRAAMVLPLARLSRAFLAIALPDVALPTRGGHGADAVLAEDALADGSRVTISISDLPGQRSRLTVLLVPAVNGQLVVTLGAARFHAPFDSGGAATIDDLDTALLASPGGPDLEIGFQLEARQ